MTCGPDDAKKDGQRLARYAVESGKGYAWAVEFCETRRCRADSRGQAFTSRWFEIMGAEIQSCIDSERERLTDHALCAAIDQLTEWER